MAGPFRMPWCGRLRVALYVLRGWAVIYGATVVPWSGPRPDDGEAEDGYVAIASVAPILLRDCYLVRPVMHVSERSAERAPADALPYLWVGDGLGESEEG